MGFAWQWLTNVAIKKEVKYLDSIWLAYITGKDGV